MPLFSLTQASDGAGLIWFDPEEPPMARPSLDEGFQHLRSVSAQVQRALAEAGERGAQSKNGAE